MKRLILALAGYALYRWWNSERTDSDALAGTPRTSPQRKPAQPA